MTFLAPAYFYAALAVATAVVGLHFIVTRQPESSPLPTVRFIPTASVLVSTLGPLEDVALLALRVVAVLLVGAAFARPVLTPRRGDTIHIVLADRSHAVANIAEVRDSVRSLLDASGVLILFDSATTVIDESAMNAIATIERTEMHGRLSSALIAALRTAPRLREQADSIELDIISPLGAAELDAATASIRLLWPGRIRLVKVAARADSTRHATTFAVRAADGDPLLTLSGEKPGDAVRVLREAWTADDTSWAARGRHTLVRWPAAGLPPGWTIRSPVDTAGGVVAGDVAAVFAFERRARPDTTAARARVVARWYDGEPAAIERAVGSGCIRDVAIGLPLHGDAVLRPSFARLIAALAAPCSMFAIGPAADSTTLSMLAGSGALATRSTIRPPELLATPLVPWLLAAGLMILVLELFARHRRDRVEIADAQSMSHNGELAA